jgi:sulfur carrier protein ThiS
MSSQLRQYRPEGAEGGQTAFDIADGATALDVMRQLGLPMEDSYLVMLNGTVLPMAKRDETALEPGDELGLFPPLKGG